MVNIFVAKLAPQTTGDDLRALFEQYGTVDTAKVILDHDTGNSRGFGFVEMPDEEEALQAIDNLHDSDIDGSRVVIKQARPASEYQQEKQDDYPRRDRGFVPRERGGYQPKDRGGYDRGGYDRNNGGGYDRGGYDRGNRGGGFNRGGGYERSGGYDRGGYDRGNRGGGFDRGGYDRGGYDRGNRGGGYDRGGGGYDRGQSRGRFQNDHRRPQHRDDEDLYRFEEFQKKED